MNHVKERLVELENLVNKNPIFLPVSEIAQFLRMNPHSLRVSMEQGKCPFGFSWQAGERHGYKIPSATFYLWYTGTTAFQSPTA